MEEIIKRCNDYGLKYLDSYDIVKSNRKRRYIKFTCDKHIKFGEQEQELYRFLNGKKSPCCYCNHSKLKETFKEEMADINPNIEILSDYVNWSTKIKCRCKKCGYEWDGHVSSLLGGQNCWVCSHNELWDKRGRKTIDDVTNEVATANPDIEVIGEYTGYHKRIKCRCKIDNTIWEPVYSHIIDKTSGCPTCRTKRQREKFGIKNDEFIEIVHGSNPNVDPIDEYINYHSHLNFICHKHNYTFNTSASTFLSKKSLGCPFCMHEAGRSCNKLPDEVYEKYLTDLDCLFKGTYVEDGNCFISFVCNKHQNKGIQKARWSNISQNKCPCGYCNGIKRDQEDFEAMIKEVMPDVKILGSYTKAINPVETMCCKCGHIWSPKASNLLSGFGCPKCNSSKGEKEIGQILDRWNITKIHQKKFENCKDKNLLPFDFYLPDYCIAIEYDGEQHFKPVKWNSSVSEEKAQEAFELIQKHDKIKDDYCYNNNISLIRIPYWENDNIEDILYDNFVKYKVF